MKAAYCKSSVQIIPGPAWQTRSHLPGIGQEKNPSFTQKIQENHKKSWFGQWYFGGKRDSHGRNISSSAGENVEVVRLSLQVLDLVTLNIKITQSLDLCPPM